MDSVIRLEEEYARLEGRRYAVACNSGTSALHLALLAAGVGPGDEVIMPDFTMAACGFAVLYTGATPVFVDCKADLNMDEKQVRAKITPKTKAIMAVHLYGRLCNMKYLYNLANKHKLILIEDACEAQGAKLGPAHMTCFSFYKNKIIHAEEGGMVVTGRKKFADDMRDLRCMAFGDKHNFYHERVGYNYRMPNSQAEKALNSIEDLEWNLEKRRQVEKWYADYFGDKRPKRDVVWVFDIMGQKPDIPEAREFFKPLSTMPMFPDADTPNAKSIGDNGFYLQVWPHMTEGDVRDIYLRATK